MTDKPTSTASVESDRAPRIAVTRAARAASEARFFLITDLEDAIAQMPKVRGVRIVASGTEIEEIHVIATQDIRPKTLVRNIVTLLLVRFGIRVDHRFLSIVQSDATPVLQLARPLIHSVRQVHDTDIPEIIVELHSGKQIVRGACRLADGRTAIQGGSLALLDAIESLIGRHGQLTLREARLVTVLEHDLILALVAWHGERFDEVLVGTALADTDRVTAAARAALDAINRKLVRLPLLPES